MPGKPKGETLLQLKEEVLKKSWKLLLWTGSIGAIISPGNRISGQNVYQHKTSHFPLRGVIWAFTVITLPLTISTSFTFQTHPKFQRSTRFGTQKVQIKDAGKMFYIYSDILLTCCLRRKISNLHAQNIKPIRMIPTEKRAS